MTEKTVSKATLAQVVKEVKHKQASVNTIMHCVYGYYIYGLKKSYLAKIYVKDIKTIKNWITKFKDGNEYSRKQREIVFKKFGTEKREWLVQLFMKKPILYLHEAQKLFATHFAISISQSAVSTILRENNLTWKTLQRRAIQIQNADIKRFSDELNQLPWMPDNLVFLDEVAFDNRGVLRKKGYGLKGQRLIYRGEFRRKPRVSMLSFLGCNGILESCSVEGTFDRIKFFQCCKSFALDKKGPVRSYPGKNSVWILDGAKIHLDSNIVDYFRSIGIRIIFLPSYCPFYNPIEIVFGWIKLTLKKVYEENSKKDFRIILGEVINRFSSYDMRPLFKKCGYLNGVFDLSKAL